MITKALQTPNVPLDVLKKAITEGQQISSAEYGYDLQAPAKNLFPVLTPIRNKIPRVPGRGANATNWKVITSLTGSGYDAMPWVPEGQRTDRMVYTATPKAASYVSFGEEASVTFEAQNAGADGWDPQSDAHLKNLQKLMMKEENAMIGGNATATITRPTLTMSASGDDGSISANTYYGQVVALTYEGYRNFKSVAIATGLTQSKTVYGADGDTYVLNSGTSRPSAEGNTSVDTSQSLFMSAADSNGDPLVGAYGYAWYAGLNTGGTRLQSITTLNGIKLKSLTTSGQLSSALTSDADHSVNATYAFDGLLSIAALTSTNYAYYKALATGTAGTGTELTPSGRGSVVEIDAMLRDRWDTYQLSPDVLYVNSQELGSITQCALNSSSGPLLHYFADPVTGAPSVKAGARVKFYFNPFTAEGGKDIEIKLHPTLPAGTILGWASELPGQYVNNNVPNVVEMHMRKDYYAVEFARKSRRYEFGTYAEGVLACPVPFGVGVITNIAPTNS
jgi:hypothetical protein